MKEEPHISCLSFRNPSLLVEILRLRGMPFEACRHCGYALSVLGHHCRHCASELSARPRVRFDVEYLPQIAAALAGLGLLAYFIFLHGFR